MERKWEWIKNRLKELEYSELSKKAGEIDKLLVEIYGNKHTPAWGQSYESINREYNRMTKYGKLGIIMDVVCSPAFCIACCEEELEDSIIPCSTCKFAKKAGNCRTPGSLYGVFHSMLLKEILKIKKEVIGNGR